MTEKEEINIEEEFRKVASKQVQSAKRRFDYGIQCISDSKIDSDYEVQELLDAAGENFAFATEIALKSGLIYDDFRKNPRFNSPIKASIEIKEKIIKVPSVGSRDWHDILAGNVSDFKYIQSPKVILNMLAENNPLDKRVVEFEKAKALGASNPFFSLAYNGEKPSGHSLYAYYQLQNPVARALIDTEFYCYVEEEFQYTIYALLTTDNLIDNSSGQSTIMPEEVMKKLGKLKDAAVELRYASLSMKNLKPEDLKFLKEFSSSVVSVSEYRFPLPKKYAQIDFDEFPYRDLGFSWFNELDKMSKYYLQKNFNPKEIISLKEFIDKLIISPQDIRIFLNVCLYFKNIVKEKLQIDLDFQTEQYSRINNFCQAIKSFQAFSSNSKRLQQNQNLVSRKPFYIDSIKTAQEEARKRLIIEKLKESESVEKMEEQNDEISGYYLAPDGSIWASEKEYVKESSKVTITPEEEIDEYGGHIDPETSYYFAPGGFVWESREDYVNYVNAKSNKSLKSSSNKVYENLEKNEKYNGIANIFSSKIVEGNSNKKTL